MDEDTSRVIYAAPRDSVEQRAHIASEEDTAIPVVSVAIFPAHTNFTTKICTGLLDSGLDLETDENDDINLDLNTDTIFPARDRIRSLPQAMEGSRQSGCSPQRGQEGAGKRKVSLDRVQRKILQ